MSVTLTLTLPESLYSRFERQAQAVARTVEEFLLQTLTRDAPPIEDDLPLSLQAEFKGMEMLSDNVLWSIAESRMNEDKVLLYDVLLERCQTDTLTTEGQLLLDSLREEADFLMLRKSQAYLLLKNRGHKLPSIEQLRQSS